MAAGSGLPSEAAGNNFILAGTPYKGNVTQRFTDFLLNREELKGGRGERTVPGNETPVGMCSLRVRWGLHPTVDGTLFPSE